MTSIITSEFVEIKSRTKLVKYVKTLEYLVTGFNKDDFIAELS